MFEKILIANRGEIALRILRACKDLGIATVAVHSTADADAMHVRLADESVCIGPPPAKDSYLNIPALLAACEITGADAVHPGYGFLSENARFAEILEEHGLHFIGPKPAHIRLMGDKIEAKRTARRLGIPCVPGSDGAITSDEEAKAVAAETGYPVLVKAAAGGGGRGMKVARSEADLRIALATARAESKAAFGDDSLYMEKYLEQPRHIEFQVLGDGEGNAIHLGERDCSLQRRHQKIWEESPSPALNAEARVRIGNIVAKAMQELQYLGVGTIEFLYENGEFYFIEMNTRIQVEHPVTEAITDIDLILEQIRVAAGAGMTLRQEDVTYHGHAIECRINAENPISFRPSPGKIRHYHPPGGMGVRVDSAAYQGYVIPPYYDSLLGKLIVHGKTRAECLMRLRRAIDEFVVDGIETTLPLFRALVRDKDILDGSYHIHWLEQFLAKGAIEE
ncbi:acetyl-CoA carboxylase biotin carboxylase subunit [Rhodoplanes elegans]|uniref:Biotin carboxylase n=1 Tax=Rhodoplanes elegans TaxID=29408 RepID=A0A327KI56_9BRAD|nr:acetyl-CoA carboxylase biotin carboxylase subunit [Rhodoplanes elegans]MBK5962186.1 acetyl-CoA carboxylase biotin carboxylase subunit [Rhodoplanes elegans]RAI37836.1 acetyl-CoA carboxylase biotin carboxylase subunit [Rhodoplanes elegans]